MQLTGGLILKCLDELRNNQIKYSVWKRYYKGEHDILTTYKATDRSNMKVIVNYPRRFINEEVSYSLGNPINYISTQNDAEVINLIDLNFSTLSKLHDQQLLKNALIFGESYELQYINNGEFKCTVLTPLNCYVLQDSTAEKNVVLAIHLYGQKFSDAEFIDVYTDNQIITYEIVKDELKQLSVKNHIFGRVPINVCYANNDAESTITDIKSLNDSYNQVLSDLVNECGDMRLAYLLIQKAELTEDDLRDMKQKSIINLPPGATAQWLIKQLNSDFVQNLLETIEKKIYQIASHIDTNEKLQSNTSSLALRSRLISLENKCSLFQAQIEKVIKQRLKNFFTFVRIRDGKNYDYRTIKLKFTSNVPSDIVSIAQVITQLQNTISQRTALTLLPFVENPDLELEQFKKEKEMIDLDRVDLDE